MVKSSGKYVALWFALIYSAVLANNFYVNNLQNKDAGHFVSSLSDDVDYAQNMIESVKEKIQDIEGVFR